GWIERVNREKLAEIDFREGGKKMGPIGYLPYHLVFRQGAGASAQAQRRSGSAPAKARSASASAAAPAQKEPSQ
ncbi:unnamed protein product, partial [Polarella glacialis]